MMYMECEYKTISVGDFNLWNKFGQDGWELVSVSNGFGYFKRGKWMSSYPKGPKISDVIDDIDRGLIVADEDIVAMLVYCQKFGVEYLLDCKPYSFKREVKFSVAIDKIVSYYERQASNDKRR